MDDNYIGGGIVAEPDQHGTWLIVGEDYKVYVPWSVVSNLKTYRDKYLASMKEPPEVPREADAFSDREQRLIDADPDWAEKFMGDIDVAYNFYFGV